MIGNNQHTVIGHGQESSTRIETSGEKVGAKEIGA
jgi:hypothetical protein